MSEHSFTALCKQLMAPRLPDEELYDTEKDPHEINNLAKSAAPAHQAARRQLRDELDKWIEETKDQGSKLEPAYVFDLTS